MNALFGIQKTINVEHNGICNYLMYHEKRESKTVVTKNKTTTIRNRACGRMVYRQQFPSMTPVK